MTLEDYNTATNIVEELHTLENSISDIKNIMQTSDTAKWNMEIRPNNYHSLKVIDHKGLLPEFLNMILSKLCEEYKELKKKLEEL